jgi:hypothetical protein
MMRAAACLIIILLLADSTDAQLFSKHGRRFAVGPNPCFIVAHDLNDDGIPEILTADRGVLSDPNEERPANDEVSYLSATTPLEYVSMTPLKTGFGPWSILVTNLDGLKAPDLAIASFHATRQQELSVFLNLGNHLFERKTFTVPQEIVTYHRQEMDNRPVFTKPGLTATVAGRFTADEYRDLVATGWSSDALLFFPGDPAAILSTPRVIPAPGGPIDIRAADFNGDNHLDLVTAMYSSNEIVLWKGDGAGAFIEVDRFPSRGSLPNRIQLADLNGDGKTDITVSHAHSDDSIVIFFGAGDFSFPVSQEILLGDDRGQVQREIRDLVAEDLNGDGLPDLAVACAAPQARQVTVYVNQGPKGAPAVTFSRESYSFNQGETPRALCAADLNGNGKKDLAVALWGTNTVAFLLGR